MPDADASISAFWDGVAPSFDDEADHGLLAPDVNAAWTQRLRAWLPAAPSDVLDLGCGTGSLSLVLAQEGHRPVGIDLSPEMVRRARAKLTAAGFEVPVLAGDASDPPTEADTTYDVVLARHVLWTLPDPAAALRRWIALLRPHGRLVLVEGHWVAGEAQPYADGTAQLPWLGGVGADDLSETLRPLVTTMRVEQLTDPDLWGRPINDERYAVIAMR